MGMDAASFAPYLKQVALRMAEREQAKPAERRVPHDPREKRLKALEDILNDPRRP